MTSPTRVLAARIALRTELARQAERLKSQPLPPSQSPSHSTK